jgi:ATP-dependent 26S proteasome regulatory subunit
LKEFRKLAARPDIAELLTEQKRQNTTIAKLKTTIKELEAKLEEAHARGIEASRVSKMKDQGRPIILGEPRNRIMLKPSQEIQQKSERKQYLVAAESKGALLMRRGKPAKEDKQ